MPIYEYQCQNCGYIEEDIVPSRDMELPCSEPCPLCTKTVREKLISLPAEHLTANKMCNAFPYLSHMTQDVVKNVGGKPTVVKERVPFSSKGQQDEFMKRNGYVYYDDHSDSDETIERSHVPQKPEHLKGLEDHPVWRKYQDDRKKMRIPDSMFLSHEELKEQFHVG